jgi:hypothetical protein
MHEETETETGRETETETGREIGRETGRETGRKTEIRHSDVQTSYIRVQTMEEGKQICIWSLKATTNAWQPYARHEGIKKESDPLFFSSMRSFMSKISQRVCDERRNM